MDYKEFMTYLDVSGTSQKDAISGLQNYVHEFPYFQTAQALLAKALKEQEHVRFDKQLKIAAAYCGDRKSLYALIHHKPSSIFIEASSASPFVSTPVLSAPVQEENPFTETLSLEETENHLSDIKQEFTPIFEPINSSSIEQNDLSEYSEEEITLESSKSISADPHDIIRERLKEILNKNEDSNDENKKNEISLPEIIQDQEIVSSIFNQEKIHQEIAVPTFSKKEEEPIIENLKEEEKVVEIFSDNKEVSESADNRSEEIIQMIAKEAVNRNDEVDRGELEYALGSTIIQSLENLPLLDESKAKKKDSEKSESALPLTFFDWLKQKHNDQFGKVEEIHAYEESGEVSGGSQEVEESSAESQVLQKSQVNAPATIKNPEVEILIDKFIATEPRIVPSKTEFYSPAKQAQKSLIEHEDLVSETLARIYRLQGAHLKARSAYQKLILLHPEKKAYFAALIEEIDNQYNNPDKQDL